MGFGTLLTGYFFLINISYFAYTDIVGAMLMLLGLYKLSGINRGFRTGMIFSAIFAVFSLGELLITVVELFAPTLFGGAFTSCVTIPRYLLIFALTASILFGIRDVAEEVDAKELSKRAARTLPFCAVILLLGIFDIPTVGELIGVASAYIYFVLIISYVILTLVNLLTLHKAYSQICMPEELNGDPTPPKSKFEFVNKFREHEAKRVLEYAEYRYDKNQKKQNKKKKK